MKPTTAQIKKLTGNKIGYKVTEDCQLDYHNFEAGEEIIIADHCNDNDWPGTVWYDSYPQIFEPIYDGKPTQTTTNKEGLHTQGEWKIFLPPLPDSKILDEGGSKNHLQIGYGDYQEIDIWYTIGEDKEEATANAELIVKAVNERQALLDSHRELVEALTLAKIVLRRAQDRDIEGSTSALRTIKEALNNAKNIQQG